MTLIVAVPPTYEPERRYILGVILGEWLGLDWELRAEERDDVRVTLAGEAGERGLSMPEGLFATEPAAWLTEASLPASPLPQREIDGRRLPVLYGLDPLPSTVIGEDGDEVRIAIDVLGSSFFMLTRYEEVALGARDAYGRFPFASSVAAREGFVAVPIVDAYVELLWSALMRLWPRLDRRRREFRVALTHDVDDPLASLGRTAPRLARQLAADALVRRDAGLAARRVRSWAAMRRGDHRLDPYNTFDFLMEVSERHGLTSAFYFLATEEASTRDGPYTLDHPWVRALITRIHGRGHEIGYHAGFDTYRDAERTGQEFRRLRTAAAELGVAQAHWGGRQHYLRWENPSTWANWEQAGLDYDSTVGFADRLGFRLGTCHEFSPFHVRERRVLALRERPLIVMDRTVFDYMKLTPESAHQAVLELARECRRAAGTLTVLWHNSTLPMAAQRRWYDEAVAQAVTQPSSSS
jgi:Family of unknown function (DUF7033)